MKSTQHLNSERNLYMELLSRYDVETLSFKRIKPAQLQRQKPILFKVILQTAAHSNVCVKMFLPSGATYMTTTCSTFLLYIYVRESSGKPKCE